MKHLYFCTLAIAFTCQTAAAQTKLSRQVVAIPQSASNSKYLVSWRMLDTDDDYTTFDVLKDGIAVKTNINTSTNYLDPKGSTDSRYQIVTKQRGVPVDTTKAITPWKGLYTTLKLDRPDSTTFHGRTSTYSPNDCSVADADGDGELEIVVKWEPSYDADNSQGGFTGPTLFDCYKFDGTKLWRINMGHNIRSGAHYVPFVFYDFDGDGKAELMVKTAPGTTDGLGHYVSDAATDKTIQTTNNEKEYLNGGGQVMYGPEYLTVFSGQDGHAIHTVYYNPNRGCFVGGAPESRTDIWGDDYGNRSERYLACAAYLGASSDKHTASAVFCRGYYTRSYLWAVDFDGKHLTTRWRHASLSNHTVLKHDGAGQKDVRRYDQATYAGSDHCTAYSQGNHNLSVADVDNDGFDEIIYGSAAIDHDGNLLWSTGLNHGDAMHLVDLMPDRPGLEVFTVHEDPPYGMHICDAATGELIVHMKGNGDTARGMAADADPKRGYEFWYFGDGNMYNAPTGSIVGDAWSENFRLYWDGDIYEELLNSIGGHNQPYLEKPGKGRIGIDGNDVYRYGYSVSCNGTKGTPCLLADIFGDWREEMIFFNNDDKATLNIFSTAIETSARVPCLLYDHVYRMGIAWQNAGYNQPPHLGYYLPDAVAARFSPVNDRTVHYVNCTGAKVTGVTAPDGNTYKELPDGITMQQDSTLCNLVFNGNESTRGEWQITLTSIGSCNDIETTWTFSFNLGGSTGIEETTNDRSLSNEYMYDLSGRRIKRPSSSGVYIINGKKVIINKEK